MIFIEIGAHRGQSFEVAKHPKFGFDEFWLIEPSSSAFEYLKRISDKRVQIFNLGLGESNGQMVLYESGAKGASLFQDKFQLIDEKRAEFVFIKRASEFLEKVLKADEVYMRINCEGSEVKILSDLLNANLLNMNQSILVDFDIIRINKNYDVDSLKQKLKYSGVRIYDENYFGEKYNEKSVLKWLESELSGKFTPYSSLEFIKFKLKLHLPLKTIIYRFVSSFIPVKLKIILMKFLLFFSKSRKF